MITVAQNPLFQVSILREVSGGAMITAPLWDNYGVMYVEGVKGMRYGIRVTNGTDRRMEFVVAVDGKDARDGEDASVYKPGLVVPAWGTYTFEGRRLSHTEVATFRFGAPEDSYPSLMGDGTANVGVIGISVYQEHRPQSLMIQYVPYPTPTPSPRPWHPTDPYPWRSEYWLHVNTNTAGHEVRLEKSAGDTVSSSYGTSATRFNNAEVSYHAGNVTSGSLGTSFGEERYSPVGTTHFTRATGEPAGKMILRYETAAVLRQLGIPIDGIPQGPNAFPADPSDNHGFTRRPPHRMKVRSS